MDTNLMVLIGLALSTGLLTALFQADKPRKENKRDDDGTAQNIVYDLQPGERLDGCGQLTEAAPLESSLPPVCKPPGYPTILPGSELRIRRLCDGVPTEKCAVRAKFASL